MPTQHDSDEIKCRTDLLHNNGGHNCCFGNMLVGFSTACKLFRRFLLGISDLRRYCPYNKFDSAEMNFRMDFLHNSGGIIVASDKYID